MFKAIQKAENVNYTLKLPVKARWAFTVTCVENVQKSEVVQCKIAVSEEPEKQGSNLSEDVRRILLDDTFLLKNDVIVRC